MRPSRGSLLTDRGEVSKHQRALGSDWPGVSVLVCSFTGNFFPTGGGVSVSRDSPEGVIRMRSIAPGGGLKVLDLVHG